MATQKLYAASFGAYLYDDSVALGDSDSDFPSMNRDASMTEGYHVCGGIRLLDTDYSNFLTVTWAEGDTSNRTLGILVKSGNRTFTLYEDLTIGDGYDVTITAEDAATSIVMDNVNFEVENTDGTQRAIKITSSKAGDTLLTLEENLTVSDGYDFVLQALGQSNTLLLNENLTIGDGYAITLTAEDAASAIVMDNANFEVESSDASQRSFKITSAKAGNTTLTMQEDLTIADGYDVTLQALGQANQLTLNEGFTIGDGNAGTLTFSGASKTLTVEDDSVVNQDLTSDAGPTFASCNLGTGELTAGSINRASGTLTLEIGGVAQVSIATTGVTITPTLLLSTCIDAGVDTDKFLVLDAGGNVDYRTGAEVLSDIGAASGAHLHDGDTLQCDGINSDGGAFSFTTSGALTLSNTVILSTCVDAGADVDKFLVLDGSDNVDYRTGAEVLSDIGAALGEAGTAAGQLAFWDTSKWAHTETSELVWDDTNKRFGVGVATPGLTLHICTSNTGVVNFESTQPSSWLWLENSTVTGGYNTVGLGSIGDDLRLRAGDADRVRIKDNGSVGIGTAAPYGMLHIDQLLDTGAVPVLTLDQADVDKEFIRLISQSTTDASQALVDAADMTTPGSIVGWFMIYVQDDQATNPITDGTYYVPFYSAPTP